MPGTISYKPLLAARTASTAGRGSTSPASMPATRWPRTARSSRGGLGRPVQERRQPARDGGRAGQLRLGRYGRRRVPDRTARGRAAANIGTAMSRDDGRTWTRALLPGTTVNACRPVLRSAHPIPASSTTRCTDVAREHAHTRRQRSLAHLCRSLQRRRALVCARRRGSRPDPRQGMDHVRQRDGEPVPGPLLPRVHGRSEEHSRQSVLDRRWAHLVGPGSVGGGSRRNAAGRAAERHARRRCRRLPRRSGAERVDDRVPLDRRWGDVHALHRLRPAGEGQYADASDLPAVGGGRLERDDLRDVVRLPFPHRLLAERSRAFDIDGWNDLECADAGDLRRRRVHSRASQPIRRTPAASPSCTPTITARAPALRACSA